MLFVLLCFFVMNSEVHKLISHSFLNFLAEDMRLSGYRKSSVFHSLTTASISSCKHPFPEPISYRATKRHSGDTVHTMGYITREEFKVQGTYFFFFFCMGNEPGFCRRETHYLYHTYGKLDFSTVFIFQGCLLHKHVWKDNLRQRQPVPSQMCRNVNSPWRIISKKIFSLLLYCLGFWWIFPRVYTTLLIPLINLTDRGLDYICSLYLI